jgi:hypothetical protein
MSVGGFDMASKGQNFPICRNLALSLLLHGWSFEIGFVFGKKTPKAMFQRSEI